MKKITIILTCCLSFSLVHAQKLQYGIMGGVNFAQMKISELTLPDQDIEILEEAGRSNGFHVGLVGNAELFGFFVQPSLLYNEFSANITLKEQAKEPELKEYFNRRIDIPVLVGKKFSMFRAMIGPVASYYITNDSPIEDISNLSDAHEDLTFGYQVGAGVKARSLFVDFKFEGSINKFGNSISVGGQDFEFDRRINQFYISVGLFL